MLSINDRWFSLIRLIFSSADSLTLSLSESQCSLIILSEFDISNERVLTNNSILFKFNSKSLFSKVRLYFNSAMSWETILFIGNPFCGNKWSFWHFESIHLNVWDLLHLASIWWTHLLQTDFK